MSQVFDRKSDYLKDDSVFAVKDQLIVDFEPIENSTSGYVAPEGYADKIKYELEHNVVLSRGKPGEIAVEGLGVGGEPMTNGH